MDGQSDLLYSLQEMADLHGDGEKKIYPKPEHYDQLSYDVFLDEVSHMSGINKSIILGALSAVSSRMDFYLKHGHSVKIEGLGTFSPALAQKKEGEPKKRFATYDQRGVYLSTINFLPDRDWIKRLRLSSKPKFNGQTNYQRGVRFTKEERLQRAIDFIREKGFMRVADYQMLVRCAHTSACDELRAFASDPESLIQSSGKGSSLVYVLRKE